MSGTFSVVIPALNEEGYLGYLLADLASQTRRPDEVIVVDAGSRDATVEVARRFPFVRVLDGETPVARGRNLGGRGARGEVVLFLDADVRLAKDFFSRFLAGFEVRRLDVACPLYVPHHSTPAIEAFHGLFNRLIGAFEGRLPSGAGACLAVRGEIFAQSEGFDPSLKFDDVEAVRRLSRGRRFGVVREKVFVSDRRYVEQGLARTALRYSLVALLSALGRHRWANLVPHGFGDHGR